MVPLKIIHLIGVALGLGVATGLDLVLINLIAKNTQFKASQFRLLKTLSLLVVVGLTMLWISGLGFLLEYQLYQPEKLPNTKLQAKTIIVILLTLNGLFIHYFVLPELKQAIGKKIFSHLSNRNPCFLFVSGALSFTSWYAALICGVIPIHSALTFSQFMFSYLALLFAFICFSLILLKLLEQKHQSSITRPIKQLSLF